MSKSLLISDLHFSNHKQFASIDENGINTRFMYQYNEVKRILDIGIEYKCDYVVVVGDIFDKRGIIEVEIFNMVVYLLETYSKFYKCMFFLTGNHDMSLLGNDVFNSMYSLSIKNNKIKIISSNSTVIDIDSDAEYHMIPFCKSEESFIKSIDSINVMRTGNRKKYLFIHQKIDGSIHNGVKLISKIKPSSIKYKYDKIFCGDIHMPQTIGNVMVLGSPYHMDFGDNGDRYFYILDNKTGYINKRVTLHPKFLTVKSDKDVKDVYNFYRVINGKGISGDKVKSINIDKMAVTTRRIKKCNSINEYIELYCNNMNNTKMITSGKRILNESKKSISG